MRVRPPDPSLGPAAVPGPTAPSHKLSFFRRLPWEIRLSLQAVIYLGPPALIALAVLFVYYTIQIPNPMAVPQRERAPVVRILGADGSLLAERGGGDSYVPIDLLPQHLVDAVVATEDRRFYKHWGLDPAGLLRATYVNLRSARLAQGGSTLTQQLAKNLFLGPERTLRRKVEEMVLALWLEVRLGKRDILELYLNRVYFGGGAYGVEAAAQRFFAKRAQDVTLAEAAMLAGLLKAPSKFSPTGNAASALARTRAILAVMVDAGMLSAEQADAATREGVRFAGHLQRGQSGYDYALDAAVEQLPQLVGVPSGEMTIETTIHPDLQRRAQALVRDVLLREGTAAHASQAGLVLLETNGAIRAVVGGRTYAESQFNRALKAKRQPGSAFKMFVYLAALESGLTPDSTVLDVPILGSGWSPRNEGAGYRGSVTMRDALAQSMNAAAARLHMSVGARKTAAVARRLGVQSPLRADASLALGTSEVTLLEMTAAYGVLANGGRSLEPHVIRRVRSGAGRVLYERPATTERMLVAPAHVAAMNDMLGAAITSGTGRRAALARHPVAGKTGTTQDFRDAWFVGYTGQLVAGVWVGNDDGRSMSRVMGGNLPARLWHDVMTIAHENRPPVALIGAGSPAPAIAGRAEAPPRAGNEPTLPRERIGADFVARMAGGESAQAAPPAKAHSRSWYQVGQDFARSLGFGS